MAGLFIPVLISLVALLVGGSGIETAILTGKDMFTKVAMSLLFTPFVLLGLLFLFFSVNSIRDYMSGADKAAKAALARSEKKKNLPPFRTFLVSFRQHYASFFRSMRLTENESIQHEATQIYRSILGLRKKRLEKLDIVLETTIKSMRYDRPDGISKRKFSDGKYDITEVEEEIAARTAYRKGDRFIYTRTDKDLACYTIVHAKQIGPDHILCPNCGAQTTRDILLDGCDHCGTKFLIEDLDERVAEFAFRPDFKAAQARYIMRRNRVLLTIGIFILSLLLLSALIVGIINAPTLMAEEGTGIILAITSVLIGSVLGTAAIIVILLFLFPFVIPSVAGLIGGIDLMSKTILKKLTESRKKDMSFGELIREYDPHFSIANFYSGLQNKISTIIYADTPGEINAFAEADLSEYLGRYSNVVDVETEYMGVTEYQMDSVLQHMAVQTSLNLTEYDGKKIRRRNECWRLKLVKAARCTTQVLRAPVVTGCAKCGTSLDLLSGKSCPYCGNMLDMKQHDWVIETIQPVKSL